MRSLEWKHKTKSPCLDCQDRVVEPVNCHSFCERFKDFRDKLAAEKDQAYEARRKETEYWKMRKQSKNRSIQARKDYSRFKK